MLCAGRKRKKTSKEAKQRKKKEKVGKYFFLIENERELTNEKK